jgi:riboflavin biosynthesis pyrimidine reductase/LPS sulfotransferase NodH
MTRPFIHINYAVGPPATARNGESISCDSDWRRVHEFRELYDAVAVGAETWKRDRPRLTVRSERLGRAPKRQPERVVFAGIHACALSAGDSDTWLVQSGNFPRPSTRTILATGRQLAAPLFELWKNGMRSMLVEGGATLIRSFLKQEVADRITVFVRTKCGQEAERMAQASIPELPGQMLPQRFGEGVVLSWSREGAAAMPLSPPTRFVVIAAPRTGSNMLCSLLNKHPEILCHHEIFNPEGIHYALDHRAGEIDLGTSRDRDRQPENFLDRMWEHRCGRPVVGFKLNRGQNEILGKVLEDRGVRKIILTRRNRVRAFVSEMIARQTGEWETYAFSKEGQPCEPIWVEADELLTQAAETRLYFARIRRTLDLTGQSFLETTYEDLCGQEEQLRIFRFLGVEGRLLQPATRKNDDALHLIANLEHLKERLRDSDLRWDLEAMERAVHQADYRWDSRESL